jgi:hypothetical protein
MSPNERLLSSQVGRLAHAFPVVVIRHDCSGVVQTMRNRLSKALSRLASTDYQRRYVLEATKDEYVLPEELVEDAESASQLALERSDLSDRERQALKLFLEAARSESAILFSAPTSPTASKRGLIEASPSWQVVRKAAEECLERLELSIMATEDL